MATRSRISNLHHCHPGACLVIPAGQLEGTKWQIHFRVRSQRGLYGLISS